MKSHSCWFFILFLGVDGVPDGDPIAIVLANRSGSPVIAVSETYRVVTVERMVSHSSCTRRWIVDFSIQGIFYPSVFSIFSLSARPNTSRAYATLRVVQGMCQCHPDRRLAMHPRSSRRHHIFVSRSFVTIDLKYKRFPRPHRGCGFAPEIFQVAHSFEILMPELEHGLLSVTRSLFRDNNASVS